MDRDGVALFIAGTAFSDRSASAQAEMARIIGSIKFSNSSTAP
jgi:hypothetical protein